MRPLMLALMLVSWLIAAPYAKTQSQPLPTQAPGKALFQQHCASCHGEDAKGAGPAAIAFKVQPPDLTALSRRNRGKFPARRVVQSIRGDRTQSAHGSTEMPVWGPVFLALTGMNRAEVERSITDLTEYIKFM
jgi:mono/diheme cytochrome c family protein